MRRLGTGPLLRFLRVCLSVATNTDGVPMILFWQPNRIIIVDAVKAVAHLLDLPLPEESDVPTPGEPGAYLWCTRA